MRNLRVLLQDPIQRPVWGRAANRPVCGLPAVPAVPSRIPPEPAAMSVPSSQPEAWVVLAVARIWRPDWAATDQLRAIPRGRTEFIPFLRCVRERDSLGWLEGNGMNSVLRAPATRRPRPRRGPRTSLLQRLVVIDQLRVPPPWQHRHGENLLHRAVLEPRKSAITCPTTQGRSRRRRKSALLP